MCFDEHAWCRFHGAARKVGGGITIAIAWKGRRANYTDSGNASFCLIPCNGKYFCCLDMQGRIRCGTVLSSTIFLPIFKLSLVGFASTTFGFWWTCQYSDQLSPLSFWNKIPETSACSTNTSARSTNVFASAGFPIATKHVVGLLFGLPEKLWRVVAVLFYPSHLSFCSLYSDLNVSELDFGNRSLNLTVAFTSLSPSTVSTLPRLKGTLGCQRLRHLWRYSFDTSSGVNTLNCSCILTILL